MPYDVSGNFTRSYNWTADKLAGIKIQSARMDDEFDNFATGMNAVLLRNGVAAFTGDAKFGGNKLTGIGSGTVGAPSIQFTADTTTGIFLAAAGAISVAAGGVERAKFNSSGGYLAGNFGVGNITSPRTAFDIGGILSLKGAFEDATVAATAISGTVNVDYKTQAVVVYTSDAAGNWTFNIRGDGSTTLDSIMATGQALTCTVEVPQGATAYYCTTITVDGAAASQLRWFGGAPTAGNVSGIDIYTITVIKTGAATFRVRASQAQAKV